MRTVYHVLMVRVTLDNVARLCYTVASKEDKEFAMEKEAISVRNIPKPLLDKAKRIAKEQDRQLSQVVRDLLREYVAENEQKLKTEPEKV